MHLDPMVLFLKLPYELLAILDRLKSVELSVWNGPNSWLSLRLAFKLATLEAKNIHLSVEDKRLASGRKSDFHRR